jgi:hypothetical protein
MTGNMEINRNEILSDGSDLSSVSLIVDCRVAREEHIGITASLRKRRSQAGPIQSNIGFEYIA